MSKSKQTGTLPKTGDGVEIRPGMRVYAIIDVGVGSVGGTWFTDGLGTTHAAEGFHSTPEAAAAAIKKGAKKATIATVEGGA